MKNRSYGRGTTYRLSSCRDSETLQAKDETLQETLQAKDEILQGLEDVVIPKRMTRDEMIKIISEFCLEWRTAEEIAVFLHRSKRYITYL